ncbi:uncharacterized mitochondrial protein AtMg00310-like [Hibiscus syriacus]|uniref:uncharacterized mitochondrial protein AtMg00310-like n=1 Tax=Hibiscus syriacus TaxID=106335 RepID=UPI001922B69F|nr:uncharacterized mitochondrial protein AtMg00310-like [Hibiscus syriacus]
MKFRDFGKLNIALLAKQGWRIVINPHSLVARLLKAKYFPNSMFMEANLGFSPSLIWRSVWRSRGLLENGMGWRIGTGLSVSIWNDFWLPGFSTRKVTSTPSTQVELVSDIISIDGRNWNRDLINSVFNDEDAKSILNITANFQPRRYSLLER